MTLWQLLAVPVLSLKDQRNEQIIMEHSQRVFYLLNRWHRNVAQLVCNLNAMPQLLQASFLALADNTELADTLDEHLVVLIHCLASCCKLLILL